MLRPRRFANRPLDRRLAAAVVDLFCRNLLRYLEGEPLLNLVDRGTGY